jgi:hypothetical protein
MSTSTADIRQFLTATFSDELVTLCFDYFRDVYESFASGMTKGQKIHLLIEHCERRGAIPSLLASLQRARPERYQERFPQRPEPRAEAQLESPRLERDPRQVFISHAYQDAEFAHRLAGDLRKRGWRVWIAPESIRPGEKWVEAINRGLEECGVFLIVLTPAAVRSQWVKDETNVAIEFEHEGRMCFVPLELERCSLPPLWRAFQRIPFQGRYETGRQALFAALEGASTYTEPPPVPSASAPAERVKPDRPTSSPAVAASSQPVALASGDLQVPVLKIADVPDITWADIPAGTLLMGSQRGDWFQTPDGAHEPDNDELPARWQAARHTDPSLQDVGLSDHGGPVPSVCRRPRGMGCPRMVAQGRTDRSSWRQSAGLLGRSAAEHG